MAYFKDSADINIDMLEGMKSTYPGLHIDPKRGIALINRDRSHRVAILSGGEAGHEPFGAGFVGENMLTGFVCGPIFDSPPVGNILAAIHYLAKWNQGGVMLLIINNTCCKLAFGLATERARNKGLNVQTAYLNDDCSLVGSNGVQHDSIETRRTLSGTIIMFKILGGLSTAGSSLEEIVWEQKLIKARTATVSVCYGACRYPGKPKTSFALKPGHISIGCGLNAEDGGVYTYSFRPIEEVVKTLVEKLLPNCLIFDKGSVVVLINCLGSLTTMESYVIANEVCKELESRNIQVVRVFVGTMMTTLDLKGFHLTLTNVTGKDSWVTLLDLETEAFAWPGTKLSRLNPKWPQREFITDVKDITEITGRELDCYEATIMKNCILAVCNALIDHKTELDFLRNGSNMELGTELAKLADATLKELKVSSTFLKSLPNTFLKLSLIAEKAMDTSAACSIYGLLLIGAAKNTDKPWHEIWECSVNTLLKYTFSKMGHRSLLDALSPACSTFKGIILREGEQAWKKALHTAVNIAEQACRGTATMISKSIKSPFYGQPGKHAEAGARAVVIILRAICNELDKVDPSMLKLGRDIQSPLYDDSDHVSEFKD